MLLTTTLIHAKNSLNRVGDNRYIAPWLSGVRIERIGHDRVSQQRELNHFGNDPAFAQGALQLIISKRIELLRTGVFT